MILSAHPASVNIYTCVDLPPQSVHCISYFSSNFWVRKKFRTDPSREKARVNPKASASSFPLNQKAVIRFWTTDTDGRQSQWYWIWKHGLLWAGRTGQRSISWSKQQSACEHQRQQIGSSFKVGAQCKQWWAQNTQKGEQKYSNCREEEQGICSSKGTLKQMLI